MLSFPEPQGLSNKDMALPRPTTVAHSRPRGVGRPPRSQSSHTAGATSWGGYCASMKPGGTFSVSQHATRLTERRPWPPRPSQRITTHPAFARGTEPLGHTTCYVPTSLTESPSSSVQDGTQGDQQPLRPRATRDPTPHCFQLTSPRTRRDLSPSLQGVSHLRSGRN